MIACCDAMFRLKQHRIKEHSWLVRLYPELSRFANDADRRAAWMSVRNAHQLNPVLPVALPCAILWIVAYSYLIYRLHMHWLLLYAAYPMGFLIVPLVYLLFRRSMREALRIELLKKGIPICLHCGYDLTGCPSVRCPECGIVTSRSLGES